MNLHDAYGEEAIAGHLKEQQTPETEVRYEVQVKSPSRYHTDWTGFESAGTIEHARELLADSLKREPPKPDEEFRILKVTTSYEVVE